MSKVIKNNDGVAVVEGTPAASLVKDVNKFFAAKPPERMAGESVSQPRTINQTIKTSEIKRMVTPSRGRRPSLENLSAEEQEQVTAQREQMMEDREARQSMRQAERGERKPFERHGRPVSGTAVEKRERDGMPLPSKVKRNEAKDKAESRRKRFFERRRSRKEAKRSQREQEATQGKFITTLET